MIVILGMRIGSAVSMSKKLAKRRKREVILAVIQMSTTTHTMKLTSIGISTKSVDLIATATSTSQMTRMNVQNVVCFLASSVPRVHSRNVRVRVAMSGFVDVIVNTVSTVRSKRRRVSMSRRRSSH
eukprot:scaffold7110_cov80-Skeletonema_marinoi.AAC.1